MRILLIALSLVACASTSLAQQRIDGTFPFQSDPAKKYSIYIPSGYNATVPHKLMLALHPFNTNRWDAQSWCDTLINFAAMNNLILACPDGGVDGRVDDPIDTAFTTALLDSMHSWYNVDAQKIYCMGFSWGGMTTYSYGLNHINRFGGFLPIGSAMSGTTPVNTVLNKASGKPWYIVHGSSDSPSSRFFPIRDSVVANGGITNWNYMTGVGHTIDFPNRNQILTAGFQWIDSVNCAAPVGIDIANDIGLRITPLGPSTAGTLLQLRVDSDIKTNLHLTLLDVQGKVVIQQIHRITKGTQTVALNVQSSTAPGVYILTGNFGKHSVSSKLYMK